MAIVVGGVCGEREMILENSAGLVSKSPACYGKEFKSSPSGNRKLLKR